MGTVSPQRSAMGKRALVVLLVALPALSLWGWRRERAERWVLELPPEERRALYERTLQTLRSDCVAPEGDDQGAFCRTQAELIIRFPECDTACQALARRNELRATR